MKQYVLSIIVLTLLMAGCSSENTAADGNAPSMHLTPTSTVLDELSSDPIPSDNNDQLTATEPESLDLPTINSAYQAKVLSGAPYRQGDRGEEVAHLQRTLILLGFDPGDADGVFGVQMKKTIESFQLYTGMDADGVADRLTVAALLERSEEPAAVFNQDYQPLKGYKIGIDPGHQRDDNDGFEPIAPGSSDLKKMVSAGTYGRYSGVREYVINLQVGLKLKAALEMLGAHVIMSRDSHGVNITNVERAKMMNAADVDCWLRIHANGSDDPTVNGMFILVPEKGTMNTHDASVQQNSVKLADMLLAHTTQSTGAKNLGVKPRSDQTGFGWSAVPVCNIEMGHMTNKEEDYLLVSEAYQNKMVEGIVQGFIDYFG